MGYLMMLSQKLNRVKWSPPLHSQIEVTAATYLGPLGTKGDVTPPSGELTPISVDGYETDTSGPLPRYKAPVCSTQFDKIAKRFRGLRPLDAITKAAGSSVVFLGTLGLLLLWVILGITLGPSDVWQIVMQNASSIQCYVSDTLLMRQQFNTCSQFLKDIGELRSRNRSIVRMLRNLTPSQREEFLIEQEKQRGSRSRSQDPYDQKKAEKTAFKIKTSFDKVCDHVATAVGSLASLILYVIGIGVWLGTGPLLSFNNEWQLYINTAVAVQLTFTSMFLQNVRRRHADSLGRTLSSVKEVDCELEWRLRSVTGDLMPNLSFTIEPPETTRTERFIDIYAYVVGSGVGVALSTVVVAVWLGVGHLLRWNSNWWLIIGTYTGLVGFVDGFVLRNVYFRQSKILNEHLEALKEKDKDVFSLLNIPITEENHSSNKRSLSFRISNKTVVLCAHPLSVIASLVVVVGLICVATGLLWSETGQLICNTPTMIVEGFLLIVLFQAHNMSNVKRREQFGAVLERRNILKGHLKRSDVKEDGAASVISLEIQVKH